MAAISSGVARPALSSITETRYCIADRLLRFRVPLVGSLSPLLRTPLLRSDRSAQNEEVEPVASEFRARRVLAISHGTAESFLSALELVLREHAHRRVGLAERVHLAEEVREARRVRLADLLERVPVESCCRERLARLRDGGVGGDCPSRLREPSHELDPVQPARKALPDEDGRAGAEDAADLVRGDLQVCDVVNDEREPGGVRRFSWQR